MVIRDQTADYCQKESPFCNSTMMPWPIKDGQKDGEEMEKKMERKKEKTAKDCPVHVHVISVRACCRVRVTMLMEKHG